MNQITINEIRIIGRIACLADYEVVQRLTKRAIYYSLVLSLVFSIPAFVTFYRSGPISGTCFLLVLAFSGFLMSFGTHLFSQIAIQLNDRTLKIKKSHSHDCVLDFDSIQSIQVVAIRIWMHSGKKWRFTFCDEQGVQRSEVIVVSNEDGIKLKSAIADSLEFRGAPLS